MLAAWRRASASASSPVTDSISLMSLPAQKARPRPATTRTRVSSIAATRSSVPSSAPVSRRLSALRASGRFSRSQTTPASASSSTIGASAIGLLPAQGAEGDDGADREAHGGGERHRPELGSKERQGGEGRAPPAGSHGSLHAGRAPAAPH